MATESANKGESELENTYPSHATMRNIFERLTDTAHVDHVYGRPIKQGDVAIIPAAEVLVAAGFGMGSGTGSTPDGPGFGDGGGGVGKTLSRPVAVIIASPDGVRVEPILDPTKIMLAALTAGGFMVGMLFRMFRKRRRSRKL